MSQERSKRSISNPVLMSITTLLILALAVSCSSSGSDDGSWEGVRTEEAGVLTVRTIQGQVWPGNAWLEEEVSIGSNEEGPYLLEQIFDIEVDSEHIYILDSKAPTLRVYDHDGQFIRNIGRSGEGPGEFRYPEQVSIDEPTGRIIVRSGGPRRFNIYSLQGDPLDHWEHQFRIGGPFPMCFTVDGELYTMVNSSTLAQVVAEGVYADSLILPEYDQDTEWINAGNVGTHVPFSPTHVWHFTSAGTIISGFSDEYVIETWADGRRTRVIQRDGDLIPVSAEERHYHREFWQERFRRYEPDWSWQGQDLPRYKPAFHQLVQDDLGRIWVFRAGPGTEQEDGKWKDFLLVDVFDADGRFLGGVDVPQEMQSFPDPVIRGDMVVAQCIDELDVPYVRRYRIHYPQE